MTLPEQLRPAYLATRDALHRVATHVLTPARYAATGRIGLAATDGGFGTPPFDGERVVRVAGTDLVVEGLQGTTTQPLTTLAAAAELALDGPPDLRWASELDLHDPPEPADPEAVLALDPEAAGVLAGWFALAWSVLESLADDPASPDASPPQLWPEHFDPAIEIGSDADRQRASYGFSPGDGSIPEPYVYVSHWYADDAPASDLWNAEAFSGAVLKLSEFGGRPDQEALVLDWLRERRDVLVG